METRTPVPAHPGAHAFPVSVKGVAVQGGKVLLLENERNEWELPGGKLELREDPADCVVREIREETGWKVTAGPLLDCWQYHIREGADVVIVTYGCHVLSTDPPLVSNEHKQAGLFAMSEIPDLVMPDGYKRSIAAWSARLGGKDAMSGPEAHVPASGVATLERSREDVLGAARPLPPDEDVVIRELSEEEDRLFLGAILDS
jgi:8-oxo-dGTP pyrophosphatase MutT (NUDIX family)